MWYHFPSVDNIRISRISATNLQENLSRQVNGQEARARNRWADPVARNKVGQKATSTQVGSATNNIPIRSRAFISNISVKKVDATNLQSNKAVQLSGQLATASGIGWTAATNKAWQSASNVQVGSATNNISIWA